jgi:peptidyl-prolyl cis-trans isomerase C
MTGVDRGRSLPLEVGEEERGGSMTKKARVLGVALLACGLALSLQAGTQSQPVLRVDGIDVPRVEYELAKKVAEEQAPGGGAQDEAVIRRAVDELVARTLLVEEAKKAGVVVTDADVQAGLADQRKEPRGASLLARLVSEFHFTDQDLANMERDRILVQRYIQSHVAPRVEPTEDDLQAYFKNHPDEFRHPEEVKVRVILKSASPTDPEAVRAVAKKAIEAAAARIKAGEDFAKVASEVSDDPSRTRGGELGWVPRGRLLPELNAAAFELQPGKVSGVIESQIGYHLLEVEAKRGAGPLTYEEVHPRLREYVVQRSIGQAIGKLVAEKRTSAKIEPLDPEIARALSPHKQTPSPPPRPTGGGGTR